MKKLKNENSFLITLSSCIVVLLVICYFGINSFTRGTYAYFGDPSGTGSLTAFKVTYFSNYPEGTLEDSSHEHQNNNIYQILDNMFEVPEGYKFASWNTNSDGSGTSYVFENVLKLTADLQLYAQWSVSSPSEEETKIAYGDVNENGEIDENDYILIENHVSGTSLLTGQALLNADVNTDGKVDNVDADIVKQAYLGTRGYTGFLPTSPILIYDIYEGNIDVGPSSGSDGMEDDGSSSGDDTSSDGTGSDEGTGNEGGTGGSSNSGSGNSSGGGGSGGTSSGGGNGSASSGNNSSNNNGNKNPEVNLPPVDDDTDDEPEVEEKPTTYEFKFMNGTMEFQITMCDILSDGTCELIFPSNNPARSGYTFYGWSLTKECPVGTEITKPIKVNSSNTYYACFLEDEVEEKNSSYLWIIVIAICVIAGRIIWQLIYRFREQEKNNQDNNI